MKRPLFSSEFYRYCRLIHGWLSALAFLALCFFAVTGLLLNHPDWMTSQAPPPIEEKSILSDSELEQIRLADDPGEALVKVAATRAPLRGEYVDGNQAGSDLFVRLQGVRGLTDLRANLNTGALQIVIEPAPALSIVNELHRAERAGTSWRLTVDIIAVVLIALSCVGYLIFLSLRFRLRTALVLTAASAAGLWSVFVLAVR